MGVIETLIVTTALAGVVGTGLGGLIGAMLQKDSNRTVSLLLSFAGGVMLSVVCFDLATEAVETNVGVGIVVAAIAFGVAITYFLNYLIDRKTNPEIPHIDENHPKTADDLDEFTDGAGRTDVPVPLLGKPFPHAGQSRNPVRHRGALVIDFQDPADPFAHFSDRIRDRDPDRDDEKGNDEEDGQRGADCRVAADIAQQFPVERPACEADDECCKHRHDEAVEEVDPGNDDQDQEPAGGRNRRNKRRAAGRHRPQPTRSIR